MAESSFGFKVQQKQCSTCIYRKDSPLDLERLLDDIRDPHMRGHFKSYRICHHSDDACCNGFWEANKDRFSVGQVAQRLGAVQFVNVDNQREEAV